MITDLPLQLTSMDMILYADDGKAVGKAANREDCLLNQADLNAIHKWSVVNRLPLSLQKCQCLHIGHGNARYAYTLGGLPITAVEQCTDLGIIRTSDFSYNTHINSIISKASRSAGMLYRAFSTRNEVFIVKLYVAYVRPILEYASVVWNPTRIGLQKDLERVQRRFTRRLRGLRDMPYDKRLEHLQLISLKDRRLHADLAMAFKALRNVLGVSANTIGLQLQSNAPTRSNGINLVVHKAVNETVAKVFKYRIAKQWNDLPSRVKLALSLNTFKKHLLKK